MRAKNVNEANLERGKDPKQAMGVGIKDYGSYVKMKLQETYPDKDINKLVEQFWENFNEAYEEWKSNDIADAILSVLEHTPLKYQMEYMESDLEMFDEGIEEGWIEI